MAAFHSSGHGHWRSWASVWRFLFVLPCQYLPPKADGLDMVCGYGRWARFLGIHPSQSLHEAFPTLAALVNVHFLHVSVWRAPLSWSNFQKSGCGFGVLLRVTGTSAAIRASIALLKSASAVLVPLIRLRQAPTLFPMLWHLLTPHASPTSLIAPSNSSLT